MAVDEILSARLDGPRGDPAPDRAAQAREALARRPEVGDDQLLVAVLEHGDGHDGVVAGTLVHRLGGDPDRALGSVLRREQRGDLCGQREPVRLSA